MSTRPTPAIRSERCALHHAGVLVRVLANGGHPYVPGMWGGTPHRRIVRVATIAFPAFVAAFAMWLASSVIHPASLATASAAVLLAALLITRPSDRPAHRDAPHPALPLGARRRAVGETLAALSLTAAMGIPLGLALHAGFDSLASGATAPRRPLKPLMAIVPIGLLGPGTTLGLRVEQMGLLLASVTAPLLALHLVRWPVAGVAAALAVIVGAVFGHPVFLPMSGTRATASAALSVLVVLSARHWPQHMTLGRREATFRGQRYRLCASPLATLRSDARRFMMGLAALLMLDLLVLLEVTWEDGGLFWMFVPTFFLTVPLLVAGFAWPEWGPGLAQGTYGGEAARQPWRLLPLPRRATLHVISPWLAGLIAPGLAVAVACWGFHSLWLLPVTLLAMALIGGLWALQRWRHYP